MQVGVVVRLGAGPREQTPAGYAAIRDMALRIEAAGFDSVWLYDHLLYRWPGQPTDGIWECWTMLAALAEATQRVQLGTMVLCTPFRNPAVLAKMAATADEVSGGRLLLGLGAGWHQPEFDAFGVPFDHRAARFEEAMKIIRPLLRDGRVDFAGRYYSARDCEIIPRGPRPDGVPLMIAGLGPRMLRLAVRYADSWNTAWHGRPESVVPNLVRIQSACREQGRDPASLPVTAAVGVHFPDLGPSGAIRDPLVGSTEEIAAALSGYAQLGIHHVMIEFAPHTPAALDRLAAALEQARQA